MNITQRKISELKFADYNPRQLSKAGFEELKKSMTRFGVVEPAVINMAQKRRNIVIGGHQRIKVAREMGLKEFPCFEVSLPLQKERELNIRLNKNVGEWDCELLSNHFDVTELIQFGFTERELDLIGLLSPTDVMEDEPVMPPEEARTARGDLYELGTHRLLCGDSTSAGDVSRLLGEVKPHLMVTDPPYGVDYDPKWRAEAGVNKNKGKMGKVKNDDRADWSAAWELSPAVIAYVWHAGIYASDVQRSLEKAGFSVIAQIVWAKDRFALSRGDYHWQHEPCWYAVRGGKNHSWSGARDQSTLWQVRRADDSGHGLGTQKPVECMARPIRNNSSIGQVIYEPFSGSGTTIIASEQLGRGCLAMEIDPRWCDAALTRWVNFTGKKEIILNGKRTPWGIK